MANLSGFEQFAVRDVAGWILTTIPYGVAIYLAMVGVEHAIRYFIEVREQQVQVAKLSEQLADARLASLQAQLNPHFLFNALNTIAVHAREGDGSRTARIVEQLSDVLRRTLGRHRATEVPLEEELDLVRQYLAIEEARFPERLRVTFAIAPDTISAAVPGFLVQHLVENGVRHGIARRSGTGALTIGAERRGESLVLWVVDDGIGFDPSLTFPEGHGLANASARLHTLYGDAASLVLTRNAGAGMRAEVLLPFHQAVPEVGRGDA
jgi:two-component system LytT family sensor kinase